MFPLLDIAGFKPRTPMPDGDVDMLESLSPGFFAQKFRTRTAWIFARLRKRYGGQQPPLGLTPAPLVSAGTAPPAVSLSGRPTLGCILLTISITTGGPLGAALFSWSVDGGRHQVATGVVTGTAVVLGSTGITASFGAGTYGVDNVYAADTPVSEAVLGWLSAMVTVDAYAKRGWGSAQEEFVKQVREDYTTALAEVKEAADSKEGLFDLPAASDDTASSINTGGPLFYSEASPYVSADMQQCDGFADDLRGTGLFGGN